MNPRIPALSTLLLSALCAAQSPPSWAAPELTRAIAVCDGRTGEAVAFDRLLDALAEADVVFLGETHIDETTHRVELGVFEGLAERRSDKVVLAMEMFQRDAQGALDAYLSGQSSEQEFLAASHPWTNYATGYRPLVEFAREHGLPVVASNFPNELRRRLAMLGDDASLDSLTGNQRALAPKKLFANSPGYWRRVDNAIRGHIGMMAIDPDDDERLYSTQSLWDNSMGEACAIALDQHPGSSVLHINGGFHSAYWDGTARQLRLRKPDAKMLTVSLQPTANPAVADPRGAPIADYIVYAEQRATDLNEGTYSVYVERETEYRLHLPAAARGGHPVPLLIWLDDDGFSAKEGLALWQSRLGADCAIAAIAAPYRETQDDLAEGGRWFWPDSFATDLDAMAIATERVAAFLMRHYAIDPTRICIAGEGTGATVVAAIALSSDKLSCHAVAFSPRRYAKLKDVPLPLPEFRGDGYPDKSLRLFVRPADQAWWSGELAEYQAIDFDGTMVPATKDPWLLATEREAALRAAIGLQAVAPADDAPRRHIVARGRRARRWARLRGIEQAGDDAALVAVLDQAPAAGPSVPIATEVRPESYASGGIPRCPGPFGGTTVIVLPESTTPETTAKWLALEANDPLNKMSRFHRLRIATTGGERDLPAILTELADHHRKNILIVPALFCADGETMRALKKSVRGVEDQVTLRWRPGLGG